MSKKNIIVFGQSGAGKSSIINMLLEKDSAKTSSSAVGCTLTFDKFEWGDYTLYDTAGFNEGSAGSVTAAQAVANLLDLLKSLETGVHLLIYVIRKGRITASVENNYNLFVKSICQTKVPVILVITGCEDDKSMGQWYEKEEHVFVEKYKMTFQKVVSVCASTGSNDTAESFRNVRKEMMVESRKELLAAIESNADAKGLVVKDWVTWVQEILVSAMEVFVAVYSIAGPQILSGIKAGLTRLGASEAVAATTATILDQAMKFLSSKNL